jgi:hypothetical protein
VVLCGERRRLAGFFCIAGERRRSQDAAVYA